MWINSSSPHRISIIIFLHSGRVNTSSPNAGQRLKTQRKLQLQGRKSQGRKYFSLLFLAGSYCCPWQPHSCSDAVLEPWVTLLKTLLSNWNEKFSTKRKNLTPCVLGTLWTIWISKRANRSPTVARELWVVYLILRAKPKITTLSSHHLTPVFGLFLNKIKWNKTFIQKFTNSAQSPGPFNFYQQSSLICLFSAAKLPRRGFDREITCNTRAVNAEWLSSTSSFSHYCLISWEQFSRAEEQWKKEAVSLCGWLWGCNLWLSEGLPWCKSQIRPRGDLVHRAFRNPQEPFGQSSYLQ